MKKFTDIKQFRNTCKHVTHQNKYTLVGEEYVYDYTKKNPILDFTGTCKLHGTNSAIKLKNSYFTCQSRNNEITPEKDNSGFATYMYDIQDILIAKLFSIIPYDTDDEVIIFGEWIGPKIQNKVAISKLLEKQFVIFQVMINDRYIKNIKELSLHDYNIYNILEIPSYHVSIDFENPKFITPVIEKMVLEVDQQCPWGDKFGIQGHGEGIVFTCDSYPYDTGYWFKAKGKSHKGSDSKKIIIEIDPIVQKSINDFVEYSVTINRLDQGIEWLNENHLDIEIENVGKYLQWISKDINKEEADVLTASNLVWKDVAKNITKKSKDWFFEYIDTH